MSKNKEVKEEKKNKNVEEQQECDVCNNDLHECDEECNCKNCEFDVENMKKQITDLQNKVIYKEAELVNYRKRKDEETANMLKYASQDLVLDILKSIDNLERAIDSCVEDDSNKSIISGIKMVYNELCNTLKSYGVVEIESLNKEFDHNLHNAVMTDNNSDFGDDIITEVLLKGYKLKDRVIRPAMVKVNKLS